MEQRMYLKAAWLFLTARVVHRTLLQEDEDAGQSWHDYGINVSVRVVYYAVTYCSRMCITGADTPGPTAVGHSLAVQISDHT